MFRVVFFHKKYRDFVGFGFHVMSFLMEICNFGTKTTRGIIFEKHILLDSFGTDSMAERHHFEVPAIVFSHQLSIDI